MFDLEGLLKKAKLKQTQFGEIMGVTDSAITKVKQGKMNLPDEWRIIIKEKLGIDPSEFDKFSYISPDNQLQEPGTFNQYSESSLINQVPFTDFMETEFLSIEAQAGYLDCLESQDVPKLETMLIPKEFEKGNYLVIEIKGDSMNDGSARSIQDGAKYNFALYAFWVDMRSFLAGINELGAMLFDTLIKLFPYFKQNIKHWSFIVNSFAMKYYMFYFPVNRHNLISPIVVFKYCSFR